jgi:antitoxin (DNA-binding transcriptional repressor) of toxin-antitoxin stability system
MPTKTIDVKSEPPNLRELIAWVQEGEEVLLVDGETPLARIVPAAVPQPARVAGLHVGQIWASDDFDAPLPDDFWTGDL